MQRAAHLEAVTHFTAALELLKSLPDTLERAQQELTLQLTLAMPLMVTKGFAAPEVRAIHMRTLELSQQVGETPQLFPTHWGAVAFYWMRGELQTARELSERLFPLAQRAQDSTLLLEANYGMGLVLYSLGELISARTHFEQVLALGDPRQQHSAIAGGGADHRVTGLSQLANVLWLLGYPDQALSQSRAALTLAQESAHPFTTAVVWMRDIMFHQFLHEARTVQQRAEALITLCNEQGFLAVLGEAITGRGWALAMQRQEEEGIQQLHQGMAADRARGMELFRPYRLALLAEA